MLNSVVTGMIAIGGLPQSQSRKAKGGGEAKISLWPICRSKQIVLNGVLKMSKPDHQLLVDFVFELLKKHGEETLKAQQEERQRMVDNAEFVRESIFHDAEGRN